VQCIYTFGYGGMLIINDYQELLKLGASAEQEILIRHFSFFGLASDGLLKQVGDEKWSKALTAASRMAEVNLEDQPEARFEQWGEELGAEAQNMITGMTKIDPTARSTIDQVLAHPWLQEVAR
jgi:hypothetical protein